MENKQDQTIKKDQTAQQPKTNSRDMSGVGTGPLASESKDSKKQFSDSSKSFSAQDQTAELEMGSEADENFADADVETAQRTDRKATNTTDINSRH